MRTISRLFSLILISAFSFACSNSAEENRAEEKNQQELDSLQSIINNLQLENSQKDSTMLFLVSTISGIQENLLSIAQRSEKLRISSTSIEKNSAEFQEEIFKDLQFIDKLLTDNKKQIAALRENLRKMTTKNKELEAVVEGLEVEIVEKNLLIEELMNSLADNASKLDRLSNAYTNRIDELGFLTEKLNTAYYTFGTKKELIDNGILDREGGVLGIGRRSTLSNDLNKNYFVKIDITETNEIKILAKRAKLISTHPENSYRFDNGAEKLVILNSEQFWSVARYLVIEVD
ncbi:MAG: Cbp1 family collagen-binding glycoprotein adhesin [Luteibaculaceae bacterium]